MPSRSTATTPPGSCDFCSISGAIDAIIGSADCCASASCLADPRPDPRTVGCTDIGARCAAAPIPHCRAISGTVHNAGRSTYGSTDCSAIKLDRYPSAIGST